MKNWKQSVFFGLVAIIALGFGFVGCKPEPDPDPEWQTKSFTFEYESETRTKAMTMTVIFWAVTGVNPTWWNYLEEDFRILAESFNPGDYTLTVQSSGNAGFIATRGTRTATVSEAFLLSNINDHGIGIALVDSGALSNWAVLPY